MMIRAQKIPLVWLPALALLLFLSGCASQTRVTSESVQLPAINADTSTASGRAAVTATRQLGTPYRYGGATPDTGFDCSGLVYYSYMQAGLAVPRTSGAQFSAASRISLRDAKPGDLLFFSTQKSVSHVAIYVGENKFVHAPSSGKTVTVGNMANPYYREHFVAAGRLDKND